MSVLSTKLKAMRACAIALATSGFVNTAASAADLSGQKPLLPPQAYSPWEFTVSGYLWAAGLNGDVATLPPLPSVSVNIGFDDVIRNLDGAFMGAGEIRNGRFLVAFDVMYTRLGDRVETRGPFLGTVTLDTSSFIGTLLAGYRIAETPGYSLDVMAGIRGYSVWTRLSTQSAIPALNLRREDSEAWVDPMIGVKGRIHLDPKWHLVGWALVGGFGVSSDFSWDVMGGVGYAFTNTWSAMLGYRALGVDFTDGGFVYDVVQHGPLLALTARF